MRVLLQRRRCQSATDGADNDSLRGPRCEAPTSARRPPRGGTTCGNNPTPMPRPQIELLAPARDAAIGIEAINHGADAVYIGGPAFGARDKAGNPLADIEAAVPPCPPLRRAHLRHAQHHPARRRARRTARRMAWDVWRGRCRRADRAGHGPAGTGPAAHPAARQHADRHPHAREGALPAGRGLLADGAGARAGPDPARSAPSPARCSTRRWNSSCTARCAWPTAASASSATPTPAAAPTAAAAARNAACPTR